MYAHNGKSGPGNALPTALYVSADEAAPPPPSPQRYAPAANSQPPAGYYAAGPSQPVYAPSPAGYAPGPIPPAAAYAYAPSPSVAGAGYAPPLAAAYSAYHPPAATPPPPPPPVNMAGLGPIPAPAPRVEYQAPVFKTFQERKREREAALRAAAAAASQSSSPVTSAPQSPAASRSPSGAGPLAPMNVNGPLPIPGVGEGIPKHRGAVPTPPTRRQPSISHLPRNVSNNSAPSPTTHMIPTSSFPQLAPQTAPNMPFPRVPSPAVSQLGPKPPTAPPRLHSPSPSVPSHPVVIEPSASPAPSISISVPTSVPARVSSPAPSLALSGAPPARAPSPCPSVAGGRPLPRPLSSRNPSSATPTTSTLPSTNGKAPNAAVQALVERSDTVSSVKSVDRAEYAHGRRTLPRPPVGIGPSRSLDRGSSPVVSPLSSRSPRKRAPTIPEVESPEQLARRMSQVSVGDVVPPLSQTPATSASGRSPVSPAQSLPPSIAVSSPSSAPVPAIQVNESPKKAGGVPAITVGTPQIPTISIGDEPDAPPKISIGGEAPSSPGFAFSGLPTIDVSSGDTRDEPGPLSIGVPAINTPRCDDDHFARPTRIEPSGAILCAGCTNPIIGRIVRAMNQRWHPQCFQCGVCGELLEHVSAYEHEGRPYCHLDYHDRFAHRCHHCKTPIVDPRFITLDDEHLGQRFYHELHFFCSECGDPFLDPHKSSAAGAELTRGPDDDGDGETNDFVIHKGHPYCERCHIRLHKPRCRGCKQPIPDVAVSAMGGKWHQTCFVCTTCSHPFANNLFFPRGDKAYCTECFERMT